MTEAEWLVATDPATMLESLQGWASERKFRLFACACSRRLWHSLEAGSRRDAIIAAERYADEECSEVDLKIANRAAGREVDDDFYWSDPSCMVSHDDAWEAARYAEHAVICQNMSSWRESRMVHMALLYCVFGNPFHSVLVNPSWLTSTVVTLAHQMYESRDFSPMPILADALQDADCDNAEVLDHCRGSGPHVRGCWVVDLLTGKT